MTRMLMQERVRRGWSREYVGRQIGVTDEAIRLIEVGKRDPSYPLLIKLEDLFGEGHRQLLAEGGEPDDKPQNGTDTPRLDTGGHCKASRRNEGGDQPNGNR